MNSGEQDITHISRGHDGANNLFAFSHVWKSMKSVLYLLSSVTARRLIRYDAERYMLNGGAFFSSLHPASVRDSFLMRKRFHWAARFILASLIASLASCQSGGTGGNSTSKADVTDPNISFSNPAKRSEAP